MIRKECLKSMAKESKKLLIMKYCMLSIKLRFFINWLIMQNFWLQFWNSWIQKHINRYTTCILHTFLHVHGPWASVWKFWLHFWNSWPQKHINRYTTCILHTFLQFFCMCTGPGQVYESFGCIFEILSPKNI